MFDGNSIILGDGTRDCREGARCYRDAYLVTLVASAVAVGLGLWSVRVDYLGRVRGRRERDGGREA